MFAMHLLAQEVPNTDLAWLLYVTLGLFFLIVVVGWLVSREEGDQPEVQREAEAGSRRPIKRGGAKPK